MSTTPDWTHLQQLINSSTTALRASKPATIAAIDQRAAGLVDELRAAFDLDITDPATAHAFLSGIRYLLMWTYSSVRQGDMCAAGADHVLYMARGITVTVLPNLPTGVRS